MTVDKRRHRCYFDIEVDQEHVGRIVFELFNDICPLTCENFRALCTGEKGYGKTTKLPLCYKGAPLHRIIKNFVIQGGDFESGDGTGGESIYGGQFDAENFIVKHDKPFLLSMANINKNGINKNGSQFFITTQPTPHLDDKHTVFGHIVSGHDVVSAIENMKVGLNHKPVKDVVIAQCGELVRKSDKKRSKESSTDSSSSEGKKRKKKKKKHSKKHKKEKKTPKSHVTPGNKEIEESACAIDPDEIPVVPANNFLMRRTSPIAEFRRNTPRGRESFNYKRRPPPRSKSGRKIKGRGNMRYRTPSSSDERSGSETPPHWKQAQSRLKKIKDVIPKKKKESDSDTSDEEDQEESGPKNPFLQSRLGLVSARIGDGNRRERDTEVGFSGGWHNTERSPESLDRAHDPEKKLDLFKQLIDKDKRQPKHRFNEDNREESRDTDHSALKSKIVVKSGVFSRNFLQKEDERNGEGYRKYNENFRRRDFFPDRRSRDFRRDSSPGRDYPHRRSDDFHRSSESKKETVKSTTDIKPKPISVKAQKRFDLLKNDLFRYNKKAVDSDDEPPSVKKSPKKLSPRRMSPKEKSPKEASPKQASPKEMPPKEVSPTRMSPEQMSPTRMSPGQMSPKQMSPTKMTPAEIPQKKKKSSAKMNLLENDLFRYTKEKDALKFNEEVPKNQKSVSESSAAKDLNDENIGAFESSNIDDSSKSPGEKPEFHLQTGLSGAKETMETGVAELEKDGGFDTPSHESKEPVPHTTENLAENATLVQPKRTEKISEVQEGIEIEKEAPLIASIEDTRNVSEKKLETHLEHSPKVTKPRSHLHSPSPAPEEPQMSTKKISDKSSKSHTHSSHKKGTSRSPTHHKASATRTRSRSSSPVRKSSSPSYRSKRPAVSHKRKSDTGQPRSRSRSTSRNRGRKRYSRSPNVRQRRSRSHPRDSGRGIRSYRYSGPRKRTPERRPFERRYRGSPYRGRARGRSASKRSVSRSRSKSVDRKRRRRHQSSSTNSSSSSSRSSSVRKRNVKNRGKTRNKRSSSSSTASSRSKRSRSAST